MRISTLLIMRLRLNSESSIWWWEFVSRNSLFSISFKAVKVGICSLLSQLRLFD